MQYLPTYKDSLLRETKMDTSANISFGDINEDGNTRYWRRKNIRNKCFVFWKQEAEKINGSTAKHT